MMTTGAKLWFGVAAAALLGFLVYAPTTEFEWFGGFTLLTITVTASMLGMLSVLTGDSTVPATVDAAAAEVPARRALPAFWPVLAPFGAGLALIGLASHGPLFYAGLGVVALVLLEWMVQSWAERATGDHEANRELRNHVMLPFEVPVVAAMGVAFIVLSFSRVLLATSKDGSVIFAIGLGILVMAIATLISVKPQVASSVVTGVVVLGAVALLAGGIVGLVHGERHIEKHEHEATTESTSETTTTSTGYQP